MIMTSTGRPTEHSARREWWRRQIQRQQNSGLTVAEFCRQLGYNATTFYYWKKRLHRAPSAVFSPNSPAYGSRRPAPAHDAAPRFVPISILDPVQHTCLEIELTNACVVRLQGHVDPKLLRAAIRAAGQLSGARQGAD
jgi:hypothetical protein